VADLTKTFLGVGFKFPFGWDAQGRTKRSPAGQSDQEIIQHVNEKLTQLFGTAQNTRVMRGDFGPNFKALVFETNESATAEQFRFMAEGQARKYEKRAEIPLGGTSIRHDRARRTISLNLRYRIAARNITGNLVYPFYQQKG